MTDPDCSRGGSPPTAEWWDRYFAPEGGWETAGGRKQTRGFARAFVNHVRLDKTRAFELLDFGCGLGEAIRVLRRAYPKAALTGMDVSQVAIARCRAELAAVASFRVGGLEDVTEHYDVIYTSNVLEHFVDYRAAARGLLAHCPRLCIMVPYEQLGDRGAPLTPDPTREGVGDYHHHTFRRESFGFLVAEGLAERVTVHTPACPGAWGWRRLQRARQRCRNWLRRLRGKPPRLEPRQAIYDIAAVGAGTKA